MPEKSRLLATKLQEFTARKTNFETELQTAQLELGKLQDLVLIGKANTESLVNQQMRVNTIRQTIDRIEYEIAEIDGQIVAEQQFEKRRRVIREVAKLDRDAEQAFAYFLKIYLNFKKISYSDFPELSALKGEIVQLKQEFYVLVMSLFPNVQMLLSHDHSELQAQIDDFISELQTNGSVLKVLRCTDFDGYLYATDIIGSRILPDNPLSDWIWYSMERIESFEKKTGSQSA